MTAPELIAELRALGPQHASALFAFLAEQAYDATTAEGTRLHDLSDFTAWLRELAAAAKPPAVLESAEVPMPQENRPRPKVTRRSQQDICPRCDHVHQDSRECGEPMGGGRICRCEWKVAA